MIKIITSLSIVIICFSSISSQAAETMGRVTGDIDDIKVNLDVRCEYSDPPGLLSAKSDWESFKQADTDGDGFYINAGGMKSMKTVAVIFHADEKIYKFGHKGDFDQTGLSIKNEFNRKDGTSYLVDLTLKCE